MFLFISIFIDKKPNSWDEHITYNKILLQTYISSQWYLKTKLQIILYRTHVCVEVHIKIFFPYYIVKCLENMISSEQDSWNNCTVTHISLKLHKLTGWFIILFMNVVQLLKHFWNYCFSSFYAFYHFPGERVGCWF